MIGLLGKIARETWGSTCLMAFGLFAFVGIVTYVMPQMMEAMLDNPWLQMPFARNMLSALLGVEVGETFTAQMMQSMIWVHPIVLTLTWMHAILAGTRVPVAEVDRGTIDFLLGLPVSRPVVLLSETIMFAVSGAVMLSAAFVAFRLFCGGFTSPPAVGTTLGILLNLAAVMSAVAGMAFFASALSDRRGRAIAMVATIVLASFLLTFLARFWAPADRISWLSILTYYQPAGMIGGNGVPVRDLCALFGVALVTWIAAFVVFTRRSLLTV